MPAAVNGPRRFSDERASATLSSPSVGRRSFLGMTGTVMGAGLMGGLLSSCGSEGQGSGGGKGPLEIGASVPLTGPYATAYGALYVGLKLAIEEVNAGGGILGRKLTQKKYDDQATPANAIAVARKMQSDGLRFAGGPTGSGTSLAAAPAMNAAKILNAPYSTDANLGDAAKFPWTFIYVYTSLDTGQVFYDSMKAVGGTKMGLLVEQGEYSKSLLSGLKKKSGGVDFVVQEFAPLTEDVVPYMRRLQQAGVDSVAILSGTPALSAQFAAGCASLAWYPATFSTAGIWSPKTAATLPAEMADRVYGSIFTPCVYRGSGPADAKVVKLAEKIGSDPDGAAAPAGAFLAPFGDFVRTLKAAAEMADSLEPEKVRDALESGKKFDGIIGTVSFSKKSHLGMGIDSIDMGLISSMTDSASSGGIFLKAGVGSRA